METKNIIITNYINSMNAMVNNLIMTTSAFNDNMDENLSVIKTLNVMLEGVRSQTVIIQQALDSYTE